MWHGPATPPALVRRPTRARVHWHCRNRICGPHGPRRAAAARLVGKSGARASGRCTGGIAMRAAAMRLGTAPCCVKTGGGLDLGMRARDPRVWVSVAVCCAMASTSIAKAASWAGRPPLAACQWRRAAGKLQRAEAMGINAAPRRHVTAAGPEGEKVGGGGGGAAPAGALHAGAAAASAAPAGLRLGPSPSPGQAPAAASACRSDHDAAAPTLGRRISRGCQVQPPGTRRYQARRTCTASVTRPHVSPSTWRGK